MEIPVNWNKKLIVFIHGHMGFKDWGCWNLVSQFFVKQHYGFLKYNGSHNGNTIDNPIDFTDLDSFSKNTYSKEILDLEAIIALIRKDFNKLPDIYLIGHSRGGGIALLNSANPSIRKIASWAGISSLSKRFPIGDELENWKKESIRIQTNGRTGQQMPIDIGLYFDFHNNSDRLDIQSHCTSSKIPIMIVHGEKDEAVLIEEGVQLASWTNTKLNSIPQTGHTFGATHPWMQETLPEPLLKVCELTHAFFNESQPDDERLSLLSELIKMANSDQLIIEEEYHFLIVIAEQLNISRQVFDELFKRYITFNPPKFEFERILQFQRLILLMNIDSNIEESELIHLKNIGIKMGLNPLATEEVLRIMHQYPNKVVPPGKLLDVFRSYYN